MADNVTGLPKRGSTYHGGRPPTPTGTSYGRSDELEGTATKFADTTKVGYGIEETVSGQFTYAKLCRNISGGVLNAGDCVVFDSAFVNRRVDAFGALGTMDGLVDDKLGGQGVVDGDLFWLLYGGPATAHTAAAIAIDVGIGGGTNGDIVTGGAPAYGSESTTDEALAAAGPVRVNLKGLQQ